MCTSWSGKFTSQFYNPYFVCGDVVVDNIKDPNDNDGCNGEYDTTATITYTGVYKMSTSIKVHVHVKSGVMEFLIGNNQVINFVISTYSMNHSNKSIISGTYKSINPHDEGKFCLRPIGSEDTTTKDYQSCCIS
jgi:hypothetical protein